MRTASPWPALLAALAACSDPGDLTASFGGTDDPIYQVQLSAIELDLDAIHQAGLEVGDATQLVAGMLHQQEHPAHYLEDLVKVEYPFVGASAQFASPSFDGTLSDLGWLSLWVRDAARPTVLGNCDFTVPQGAIASDHAVELSFDASACTRPEFAIDSDYDAPAFAQRVIKRATFRISPVAPSGAYRVVLDHFAINYAFPSGDLWPYDRPDVKLRVRASDGAAADAPAPLETGVYQNTLDGNPALAILAGAPAQIAGAAYEVSGVDCDDKFLSGGCVRETPIFTCDFGIDPIDLVTGDEIVLGGGSCADPDAATYLGVLSLHVEHL